MNLDRLLSRIPGWLGSKVNIGLGLALLVVLVVLPLLGVPVPDHFELLGGNWTNCVGYVAASIAAGASVVNLHEHRKHRRDVTEHHARVERQLAAQTGRVEAAHARIAELHEHVTKPKPAPRTGRTRKETAP